MHIGTMVEFAFALVGKLDAINKHSFNDFKLRVGTLCRSGMGCGEGLASKARSTALAVLEQHNDKCVVRVAGLGGRWMLRMAVSSGGTFVQIRGEKWASWWLSNKASACSAGAAGDLGLIPGLGRSPGGGRGNPLQYSCLENPMDRGTWQATVHRVTKSPT